MAASETIRIFDGGVAIITGGASGIGAALARELAKRGCEVVLADRQIDLAEEVASNVRDAGGKASAAEVNVVDYHAVEALIYELSKTLRVEAALSGIRVSVFCPGFIRTPILERCGKYGKILQEPLPEQYERMQQVIEKFKPMPPDIFAVKALNAVARNEAIIVIPSRWKFFWWLDRLFPTWNLRLTQQRVAKYFKK